jgi:hypothetical protein
LRNCFKCCFIKISNRFSNRFSNNNASITNTNTNINTTYINQLYNDCEIINIDKIPKDINITECIIKKIDFIIIKIKLSKKNNLIT